MNPIWYILPFVGVLIGSVIGGYNHKKYNERKKREKMK